ncbi:DUF1064 domain-containing protein [Paenibacillus xanthanilyticus]|uniref:DUF1064 domain-containing protein n=1 Tax=Paenibacillus xanthanilyticus TaxID=1783531 RepID=A0ABV8K9Z2_9BACL
MVRFARKKKEAVPDQQPAQPSKYNSQKTILTVATGATVKVSRQDLKRFMETAYREDEHLIFDSELEAKYYRDMLLPLIKDGRITVELQPKFTLLEKFEKQGTKHQAITYSPDFKVTYVREGRVVLIDVKGAEDQKFPLKRKLFDANFPEYPPLVVMKYCKKFGGWITIEEYIKKKREENKQKKAQ